MSIGTSRTDADSLRKDILAQVSTLISESLAVEAEKIRLSIEAASVERIRQESASILAVSTSIHQELTERCKLVLVDVTDLRATVTTLMDNTERTIHAAVEPLRKEVALLGPVADSVALAMSAMREADSRRVLEERAHRLEAQRMAQDTHTLISGLMLKLARVIPEDPQDPPHDPPPPGDV